MAYLSVMLVHHAICIDCSDNIAARAELARALRDSGKLSDAASVIMTAAAESQDTLCQSLQTDIALCQWAGIHCSYSVNECVPLHLFKSLF